MKHNLDQNVEVQGIVKPGANIEVIVNTLTKTIEKLTKKEIVVVWGGTRDVGKSETDIGLHQIKNFVENHSQTNFVVMSVPYRHDLDPKSCINDEVKVYNKKLKKYLKVCENTQIIEVDDKRQKFTKHGRHMNSKGKDQIARKTAQTIKVMLHKKMSDPIILKDREDLRTYSDGIERIGEFTQKEVKKPQSTHEYQGTVRRLEVTQKEVEELQSSSEEQAGGTQDQKDDKLPSKRARKPPTTHNEDFLWLDRNRKQ